MSSSKYSVLFMRDDDQVRRLRLNPIWFKIFIYILLFILICAVGGVYATYALWQRNLDLTAERNQLEREAQEVQVRLERLQNVEKILQANDPAELQALLGPIAPVVVPADPATPPAASEPEANATAAPVTPAETTPAETPPAETPVVEPQAPRESIDLVALLPNIDKKKVSIDDFALTTVDKNRLNLRFMLTNFASEQTLVAGKIQISLLTKKGEVIPLDIRDDSLLFQIPRFKAIETRLPVPDPLTIDDLFAVRMEISSDKDGAYFHKAYLLSQFLR